MSKTINEIIKESLIEELDASNIAAENLKKAFIEAKETLYSILDSILEELVKEEEFKPEYGDAYWVVGGNGEPIIQGWDGYPYDKIALENNAIFKTQEAAEFEAERLKVLRELEKMGRAFKPKKDNYTLCLQHDFILNKNMFRYICDFDTRTVYGNYYFDTKEELEQAIEKIGKDRIKKYLFGVEE